MPAYQLLEGEGERDVEFTSHAKQFENELENKLHNLIIGKSNLKFHLEFANYFCFNSDKNLWLPSQFMLDLKHKRSISTKQLKAHEKLATKQLAALVAATIVQLELEKKLQDLIMSKLVLKFDCKFLNYFPSVNNKSSRV